MKRVQVPEDNGTRESEAAGDEGVFLGMSTCED